MLRMWDLGGITDYRWIIVNHILQKNDLLIADRNRTCNLLMTGKMLKLLGFQDPDGELRCKLDICAAYANVHRTCTLARHQSLGSSVVRSSFRSTEGCGFDPCLRLINHFLNYEHGERSSGIRFLLFFILQIWLICTAYANICRIFTLVCHQSIDSSMVRASCLSSKVAGLRNCFQCTYISLKITIFLWLCFEAALELRNVDNIYSYQDNVWATGKEQLARTAV